MQHVFAGQFPVIAVSHDGNTCRVIGAYDGLLEVGGEVIDIVNLIATVLHSFPQGFRFPVDIQIFVGYDFDYPVLYFIKVFRLYAVFIQDDLNAYPCRSVFCR